MDVLGHGLQGLEVGDVAQLIAGFLQQGLVDDDTKGLIAVTNSLGSAILNQVEVAGGHLVQHLGAGEIQAVVAPVQQGLGIAALEQGGSLALAHLSGQGGVVLAGGGGDDLDLNAGLLGVQLGQILPGLVSLGLEVQIIDLAGSGGCGVAIRGSRGGLSLAAAGGQQTEAKGQGQQKRKYFFHLDTPFPCLDKIYFHIRRCKNQLRGATLPPARKAVLTRTWRLPARSSTMSKRMRTASSPMDSWG